MLSSVPVRTCVVAGVFALALLASGCAGRGMGLTTPSQAGAASRPAATTSELYVRLEASRAEYNAGIDLIDAGQEVAGEGRIAAASRALGADAETCARTRGCDVGRFVTVLQAALDRQGIALKRQVSRVAALEADLSAGLEIPTQETAVEVGDVLAGDDGTEEALGSVEDIGDDVVANDDEFDELAELIDEHAAANDPPSAIGTAIPEVERTAAMLRGNDLRQVIELNGHVRAALNDWLTWLRPMFTDAWTNYGYLRDKIAPIYTEAGLPEALLFAMIATETGGKVHATSRAGATGILQFMPGTGRRFGLGVVDGFDQRLDPVSATRANVAYLNEQFKALNDDLEKALAAYNGGEGRLRGLHNRIGPSVRLWDPRFYLALPSETRDYVPRILAAAWLFLHPTEYGLELPAPEATTVAIPLHEAISIDELTICLGQAGSTAGWFRTLRNLNPRYGPAERIPAGREIELPDRLVAVYTERCVSGEPLNLARDLYAAKNSRPRPAPAATSSGGSMLTYKVRPGDTLGRIAARHSCASLKDIARINKLRPPKYVLRSGQRLKIPRCS